MKVFDESGNFLGEFIEATGETISTTKDIVVDAFSVSIILGILGLIFAPWLTILVIALIFIFKLFIFILKLVFMLLVLIAQGIYKLLTPIGKGLLKLFVLMGKGIWHLLLIVVSLFFYSLWWLIRLPFTLIFLHRLPCWNL